MWWLPLYLSIKCMCQRLEMSIWLMGHTGLCSQFSLVMSEQILQSILAKQGIDNSAEVFWAVCRGNVNIGCRFSGNGLIASWAWFTVSLSCMYVWLSIMLWPRTLCYLCESVIYLKPCNRFCLLLLLRQIFVNITKFQSNLHNSVKENVLISTVYIIVYKAVSSWAL